MKSGSKNLQSVVWKEGRHYVAQCLNVDISSFGKNKADALKNLDEALELYFEDEKTIKLHRIERPEIIQMTFQHA